MPDQEVKTQWAEANRRVLGELAELSMTAKKARISGRFSERIKGQSRRMAAAASVFPLAWASSA